MIYCYQQQRIKLDKKSTNNDELAEAIIDITEIVEHLSLEFKLYKSNNDKQQTDELANVIAFDHKQLKITGEE